MKWRHRPTASFRKRSQMSRSIRKRLYYWYIFNVCPIRCSSPLRTMASGSTRRRPNGRGERRAEGLIGIRQRVSHLQRNGSRLESTPRPRHPGSLRNCPARESGPLQKKRKNRGVSGEPPLCPSRRRSMAKVQDPAGRRSHAGSAGSFARFWRYEPDWEVVGEASDGRDAVRQAEHR